MPDKFESSLRSLIQVLHDGHKGLAEIGRHLKDQNAKDSILIESLTRQQFAGDLENELHRHGVAIPRSFGVATESYSTPLSRAATRTAAICALVATAVADHQ